MRTIAIINQKGGCGKTTASINLAATLAAKGQRTLLVDMDPQSHCAMGLAVPEAQLDRSIADLLRVGLDGSLGVADITWQISRHLDLAPSTIALAGIEQQLAGASDKDRRLVQVLSTAANRYDFCIVDCPPSIGLLTFNALRAADEVAHPRRDRLLLHAGLGAPGTDHRNARPPGRSSGALQGRSPPCTTCAPSWPARFFLN